jgi:hypothetical protein
MRIFGPKKNEGTGEWRNLHNEESQLKFVYLNITWKTESRKNEWGT